MRVHNYVTTPKELKPCPFCGSKVEWYRSGTSQTYSQKITIKCPICKVNRVDAMLNRNLAGHDTEWLENKAIENWNRRVGR